MTETLPPPPPGDPNMGKDEMPDKSPRNYTDEERKAILEQTRGLGERALKEACKKLPVSRTTVYMWRKELWGTMNAHGIITDHRKPKPEAEPHDKPPPKGESARRMWTEKDKRKH